MNPAGIIIAAAGVFCIFGAACNWDWFINSRKARTIVALCGRTGARVVYGLLGLVMSVLGGLVILDVVDVSRFARPRNNVHQPATPELWSPPTSEALSPSPTTAHAKPGENLRAVTEADLEDYVRFPKSQIKVRQPTGFELAENFEGFAQPATQSSVMIVTLPAPFEKTTAGFDEQAIKSRGWKLWSSNQSSFNGRGEMLVHFEQSANGSVYLKWLRAFGDQTKTTIVTATFLKDQEQAVSAVLRATVLSAQVDSGKSNDSSETTVTTGTKSETNPFGLTLGESSKLKLAPAIANALLYTTDGTIPIKSPSEPLFVVVPVNVLIAESERESYAEQRVSKTADFKNPLLKSNESIELAGLSGFETIADGTDAKSGTPLVLYQVVLFEDNRCLVLQGMVGAELADEYLPEFQKLSRGLQRPAKPSPKGRK